MRGIIKSMKLIIGLGNPGEKYTGTRHNIGFETLDHLLKKYEPLSNSTWETDKKTKSVIKKAEINKAPVLLAKPQTYMNNSGMAASLLLSYYKIKAEEMIIIHDDLDLPLGKIQIRFGGGTAGHNGLESIIEAINTEQFVRIRMGVGHPRAKTAGKVIRIQNDNSISSYVISHFAETEHKDVRNMKKHVQKQLELLLEHGFNTFMSKYNTKS